MISQRLFAAFAFAITMAAPLLGSVQYRIEHGHLAPLIDAGNSEARIRLERIPIDGELKTLALERFDVFADGADIKVLGAHDEVLARLPVPAIRTYRGSIEGEPDALAFLAVSDGRVDGVVFREGRRFGIGSRPRVMKEQSIKGDRFDVFTEESDALDDFPTNGKDFFCDTGRNTLPGLALHLSPDRLVPQGDGALSTASARWVINLAVETDYELYVNVGATAANVTTFVTNLVGALSTIYNRELTAEVSVTSLTINSSASDPFVVVPGASGTWNGVPVTFSTMHALLEFGDRWHNSAPSSQPRSTTVLLSGKDVNGGIAWTDALGKGDAYFDPAAMCSGVPCHPDPFKGHYGGRYSFNGGNFPGNPPQVPNPDANAPTYAAPAANYWPLLQLAHETGHNVFSGHTHCKELNATDEATYGRHFVDGCFNGEGPLGCYDGSESLPLEKGTIMSYCHFNFGPANTRYIFGKVGEASSVMPVELKAALQNATPGLSAITAPATLAVGESGNASVTNVSGVTYLWTVTNGVINSGQGTNAINFTAQNTPTNVRVKATNTASAPGPQGQTECSIADYKDVPVTGVLSYDPPLSVTATAIASTSVQISWSPPASGATPVRYDVYRSTDAVNYTSVGFVGHPATTFVDTTASASVSYLYYVRSAGTGGANPSSPSNKDLATTIVFIDDPVVAGVTTAITAHITELRSAVDAVRTLAGMGSGTYTDPTLTSETTPIKATHINDLRSALDAARASLSLPSIGYGETVSAGSTTMGATHITELRSGVK